MLEGGPKIYKKTGQTARSAGFMCPPRRRANAMKKPENENETRKI
jgi:hypothetical protein